MIFCSSKQNITFATGDGLNENSNYIIRGGAPVVIIWT